jgi:ethanolamine utilization cobalamin adenosyltransferase
MLPGSCTEYTPPPGAFVTPAAREYLASRGIALREAAMSPAVTSPAAKKAGMPFSPVPDRGKATFEDAETGEQYAEKPEDMTHLRANLLVSKAHPRIRFRGGLDSLEAEVLEAEVLARERGEGALGEGLGELLHCLREIMSAEVNERPLGPLVLFGLSADEIRAQIHHVEASFGMVHPIPEAAMGALAVRLNTLRTRVRELELLAVRTFCPGGNAPRPDIIRALNRLSGAVYWLLCRHLSEKLK